MATAKNDKKEEVVKGLLRMADKYGLPTMPNKKKKKKKSG